MRVEPQFKRVRLELAREPGHPEGDSGIGYTLIAPLDDNGFLDAAAAHTHRERCKVSRVRNGVVEEERQLRRRPGGSWAFHLDYDGLVDDDPGYRLGEHRFVVGEYVTIQEDGGSHTYRIVSVRDL